MGLLDDDFGESILFFTNSDTVFPLNSFKIYFSLISSTLCLIGVLGGNLRALLMLYIFSISSLLAGLNLGAVYALLSKLSFGVWGLILNCEPRLSPLIGVRFWIDSITAAYLTSWEFIWLLWLTDPRSIDMRSLSWRRLRNSSAKLLIGWF